MDQFTVHEMCTKKNEKQEKATILPSWPNKLHQLKTLSGSDLPMCLTSRTHKFPKRHTNLVLHVPMWMHKITITITAYALSSLKMHLTGCSDTEPQFANICIRRALFHIKQKNCAILAIKQLLYNPTSKNSKEIDCLIEESFLPKQQQKHAISFLTKV